MKSAFSAADYDYNPMLVFQQSNVKDSCYVGPCHHGMVSHQVANGGDSFQIWRVATNMLNKQSQTDNKG
jgi:hypothetical protein